MDRQIRANLYRNVFGIAWIEPEINSPSQSVTSEIPGRKPSSMHVVGTGFMLDSGIGITAAHM